MSDYKKKQAEFKALAKRVYKPKIEGLTATYPSGRQYTFDKRSCSFVRVGRKESEDK